jgi:two-component system response regulator HydG
MLDRILIVDDDVLVLETLAEVLGQEGFPVSRATDARQALNLLAAEPHALILSDIRMPNMDGMGLLREVRRLHPGTDVLLMTGFGSLDGAIDAMTLGAADYLIKPLKSKEVIARVRAILLRRKLEAELHALQSELRARHDVHNLVAASARMTAVVAAVQRVKNSASPVVIFGEEGSGRRFLARTVHYSSARRGGEFALVDGRMPPPGGAEALLFGERTPSGRRRRGLLEKLRDGTVHIAALHAFPAAFQARLGRSIAAGRVEVDGDENPELCVRLVLSVDEPVADLLASGRLAPELACLRDVTAIHVPPLRHRLDDVPALVAAFLDEYSVEHGRALRLGHGVIELVASHALPGNVRQLFTVLGHAANLSVDGLLSVENVERSLRQSNLSAERPISDHLGDREYQLVLRAVQRNPGRLDQAARELGVSRTTLWRRMRKHGIRLAVE